MHRTIRLAAAALCVAFIVIVLIKGVWILAVFGAAMLALQLINLALGPRQRSLPPAPSASAPPPAAPRASDAARARARRGRGRR